MSAQDTAQRGVATATTELERRGAVVLRATTGRSRNSLRVSLPNGGTVDVYVKSRASGTWQTSIEKGTPRAEDSDDGSVWMFVDLLTEPPALYITPTWWMENDIYETHQKYLARHGGQRARTPASTHHSIPEDRIREWRERWDLLGLY